MVDWDGRSYSEFDETGNYLRTVNDNWWHNFWHGRTGRIVNGEGKIIQSFIFADPKNDVDELKEGKINRIVFVQENEIISMLSKAGVYNEKNNVANAGRYIYVLQEGGNRLDFSYSSVGIPAHYPEASDKPMQIASPLLFMIDGVAHNHMNYGNFLFGASGIVLGLTLFELQIGAHWNSIANPESNDYHSQFDSRDDQFSIRMGARHARRNGYKNKKYVVTAGPLVMNNN